MDPKPTELVRSPEEKAARKALRRARRDEDLREKKDRLVDSSLSDVALKRFIGLSDEDLIAKGLNPQQRFKVRQWELPKKAIAFALEASNQHVTAMLRNEADKKGLSVNVEKLIIKLPSKGAADLPEPIVIDVEAK